MSHTSADLSGFFPPFAPQELAKLAGPLPTWALSTESPWQQWGLAESIVRQAPDNQVLMRASAGLLAWAWQERPLDAPTATLLATLDARYNFLSGPGQTFLHALKKRLRPPAPSPLWEEIKLLGDPEHTAAFLEQTGSHHALARLGEAFDSLIALPDRDRAAAIIHAAAADPTLENRLLAELDHHHGLSTAQDLCNTPFAPFGAYLAGLRAFLSNDQAQAASLWRPLAAAMPWNVNLTLIAHDAAFLKPSAALPDAPTAILAYCWNKAELIAQTLESVFASNIGHNRVFVLDNGSTDATPDVLQAAANRFGPERLAIVTLPINIGAPAARNWLLSLPEVRNCRYAAFLDDDVILPTDWLAKLLQTASRNPKAGVIGCRIRDHVHPRKLQSADYHLLHRLPGDQGDEPGERLRVFMNCTGVPDLGLFSYERPCLSVSGCCHLLDLSLLDCVGTFDVRFTPTQFDDLDRDIRCFIANRPAILAGHLAIGHVQRSSLRQASSPAQVAHILGNKIKLEAKYGNAAIDQMIAANFQLAWNDLLAKRHALDQLA
jgi:hypothetical protein